MSAPLGEVGRRFRGRYLRWWQPQFANPLQHVRWRARRFRQLTPMRRVSDADAVWRRGDDWQRILSKKWNSRVFAQRAGIGVPKLLAWGRRLSSIPLESLPPRFVLKPCFGGARRGVYAMADGRELFRQIDLTATELRERLSARPWSHLRNPLLVEELVDDPREPWRLPTGYHCYVFGSHVAAIQVLRRYDRGGTPGMHRYYSPDWRPFDRVLQGQEEYTDDLCDPPDGLDQLLTCAATYGRLYGIAIRVDFYMSERGPLFGELAPYPYLGAHLSPFAQSYFGKIWERELPEDWEREGEYSDRRGIQP